jgi:hypothetical protein
MLQYCWLYSNDSSLLLLLLFGLLLGFCKQIHIRFQVAIVLETTYNHVATAKDPYGILGYVITSVCLSLCVRQSLWHY